jgi:predicted ferric reductase
MHGSSLPLSFYALSLLLTQTIATNAANDALCGPACQLSLSHLPFTDLPANFPSPAPYYQSQCLSPLRTNSIAVCMRTYCPRPQLLTISLSWASLNSECEQYANTSLPNYDSVADSITDEETSSWRRITLADFPDDRIRDEEGGLSEPIFVERELYDTAFRTKQTWADSVTTREAYGHALLWFWAAVVLCSVLQRLWNHCTRSSPPHTRHYSLPAPLQRLLLLSHPSPSQLHHHTKWYMPTIPPLPQALLLLTFILLNLTLTLASYPPLFPTHLYWPNPSHQLTRYVADRTGVLSLSNLPLLFLLSTRNNLVLLLTNWSFPTAMTFHRWLALLATLQAVVHSIAYCLVGLQNGSWEGLWADFTERYWNMGVLGTVAMAVACGGSVRWLRRRWYEVFLAGHIALAVAVLWGVWEHVRIFDDEGEMFGYAAFVWGCVALLVGDRVGRVGRLVWLNGGLLVGRKGILRYDEAAGLAILEVPIEVRRRVRAGEYYFMYVLHGWGFWESHPFTVASWEVGDVNQPVLKFLIRPYDGFTQRLAGLARQGGGANKVRVLIEGPYGPAQDLSTYDEMVFIVGGSGVAVALAYLTDYFSRLGGHAGNTILYRARRIHIVWAVRTVAMYDNVWHHHIIPLIEHDTNIAAASVTQVHFSVYITQPSTTTITATTTMSRHAHNNISIPRDPQAEEPNDKDSQSEASPLLSPTASTHSRASSGSSTPLEIFPASPYTFFFFTTTNDATTSRTPLTQTLHHNQRPQIAPILQEICGSINNNNNNNNNHDREGSEPPKLPSRQPRSIAVVSCGPTSLSHSTRRAVVAVLEDDTIGSKKPEHVRLDYWNESYSW